VRPASQVAVTWRQLADRYPQLAGLQLRPTRPVEVPNVGTLYAVEAGAFETRADAQALCDRLRAQGQSCKVLGP
jgi:cell division septation protein DedD